MASAFFGHCHPGRRLAGQARSPAAVAPAAAVLATLRTTIVAANPDPSAYSSPRLRRSVLPPTLYPPTTTGAVSGARRLVSSHAPAPCAATAALARRRRSTAGVHGSPLDALFPARRPGCAAGTVGLRANVVARLKGAPRRDYATLGRIQPAARTAAGASPPPGRGSGGGGGGGLQSSGGKKSSVTGRVVSAGKSTGYFTIIVVGVGLFGLALYYTGVSAYDDWQAQKLFDEAFEILKENAQLQSLVGTPMKGFGERGHRGPRLTRHLIKDDAGREADLVMRFHVSGPTGTTGNVYLHKHRSEETGAWEFVLLEVDVPDPLSAHTGGRRRVVVIDNRPRVPVDRPPRRKGWFGMKAIYNP
ncbi:TIM21-domain-containing protein [Zopfochytrium polystomum]|nr:TIM21-domain-containing protein [Zopfochytrium polystomum]